MTDYGFWKLGLLFREQAAMLSLTHFRCFCVVVVAVCRCLGLSGDLGAGEDVQLHLYRCSGLTLRSKADTGVGEWMSGTAES